MPIFCRLVVLKHMHVSRMRITVNRSPRSTDGHLRAVGVHRHRITEFKIITAVDVFPDLGPRLDDFDVEGEQGDPHLREHDLRGDGDRTRGRWQVEVRIDFRLVGSAHVSNCSIARGNGNGLRVRGILDRQRPSGGFQDESLEIIPSADIEQPNHYSGVRAHAAAAVVLQFSVGHIARVAPCSVPVYGAASSRTGRMGLRG